MSSIVILLFLFLSSAVVSAQNSDAPPEALEALEKLEGGDTLDAIRLLKLALERHPDHPSNGRSLWNVAYLYDCLDSMDQAMDWYNRVIAADLPADDPGSDLLNMHANYTYNALMRIGSMYYNRKVYDTALAYYRRAPVEQPFYSTSGTSIAREEGRHTSYVAECYMGMGFPDSALRVLFDPLFKTGNGYRHTSQIKEIIAEHFDRQTFLAAFDSALATIRQNGDLYVMNLRGQEMMIMDAPAFGYEGIDGVRALVRKSSLYRWLVEGDEGED